MAQNHSPLITLLSPNLTAAQRFRLGVGVSAGAQGQGQDTEYLKGMVRISSRDNTRTAEAG